jgi:hypothetical protein
MKKQMEILFGISAVLILSTAIYLGRNVRVTAQSPDNLSNSSHTLPTFLEKGKTYTFYGSNPENAVSGKVEKFDANSGWVYVNYVTYINVPKKRSFETKLIDGYCWINMNNVFSIGESK